MRVASAFIRKNSDEIPGFRALGFEADEQMTPMLDQLPSLHYYQVRYLRCSAGLFDASELVKIPGF